MLEDIRPARQVLPVIRWRAHGKDINPRLVLHRAREWRRGLVHERLWVHRQTFRARCLVFRRGPLRGRVVDMGMVTLMEVGMEARVARLILHLHLHHRPIRPQILRTPFPTPCILPRMDHTQLPTLHMLRLTPIRFSHRLIRTLQHIDRNPKDHLILIRSLISTRSCHRWKLRPLVWTILI